MTSYQYFQNKVYALGLLALLVFYLYVCLLLYCLFYYWLPVCLFVFSICSLHNIILSISLKLLTTIPAKKVAEYDLGPGDMKVGERIWTEHFTYIK